jgi:hypothetical protein
MEKSVAGDLNGWRRMVVRTGTRGTPRGWALLVLMAVGLVLWGITGTVVAWLAWFGVVFVFCLWCIGYADRYLTQHPDDDGD